MKTSKQIDEYLFVKENNLSLKSDEIKADAGSDEYVVYALSLFLRDETLDECPIRVVSKKISKEKRS